MYESTKTSKTKILYYELREALMNETRKTNLSDKMKSRWNEAREYSLILKIPEIEIYNYYLDICRKYKSCLLNPNEKDLFIEGCMSEIESRRKFKELMNKALGIKEIEKEENKEGSERQFEKDRESMNDLKLMLWVIGKIGSIDKAEKVFKAAKMAMEVMES